MTDGELLALHRAIVGLRSLSREEGPLADYIEERLAGLGVEVERLGDNLVAKCGTGPVICLNSHLDTVPPSPGWRREPFTATVENGRVYGLGSNDAKASVAAMLAAFLRLRARGDALGATVVLTLVTEEEVGSGGTQVVLAELARRGLRPAAGIVGEPTGLDIAVAQKGLLVLELRASGRACHAAHARALGAPNALRILARDLVAIEGVPRGPDNPWLGPVTLEPTVVSGGTARNTVPAEASCILDIRTNPEEAPAELVARLRAVILGELVVRSERLRPVSISDRHPLVCAAAAARPGSRLFGSRGVSDLAFFDGIPGIKVGPGVSERSHTADEFVLESEIVEGAAFFEQAVLAWAASGADGGGA
ncbi:MAG: M20/M25/M40 family metallo-hydrolase [Thermoanaerobaculales bacterium]